MTATIRYLPPIDQLVFRRMALHPGPHVTSAIAATLADVSVPDAEAALESLHRHGLVVKPDPHGYGLHDLVRALAHQELAAHDDDRTCAQAQERLFRLAAHLLERANSRIAAPVSLDPAPVPVAMPEFPEDEKEALEWLAHHFDDLRAVARLAIDRQWPTSWHLTVGLSYYMRIHRNIVQAEELNESALQIALLHEDTTGQAHCHAQLGVLHRVVGRYRTAMRFSGAAKEMFDAQGNIRDAAHCGSELSVIHYHLAEYPAALEVTHWSIDVYRRLHDRRGTANALGNLGMINRAIGDYSAARAALTEALSTFREIGSGRNEAWMLIELGTLDRLTGNQQAALNRFSAALDINVRAEVPNGCAWARREMGVVKRIFGHYTEAQSLLEEALSTFTALGSTKNAADAHVELCALHRQLGNFDTARHHGVAALDAYTSLGNDRGAAWTEVELGAVDVEQGLLTEADARFEHARQTYARIGDRSGAARVRLELGRLAVSRGEDRVGRTWLRESLALYNALGAPQAGEARELLGEA